MCRHVLGHVQDKSGAAAAVTLLMSLARRETIATAPADIACMQPVLQARVRSYASRNQLAVTQAEVDEGEAGPGLRDMW